MPKFFRLEFDNGRGVYAGSDAGDNGEDANDVFSHYYSGTGASERHPMPSDDSLLCEVASDAGLDADEFKWSGKYRFGFASIAQLRSWFYADDSLRELGDCNVRLSVYNPP